MNALDQLFQDYHTACWVAVGMLLLMLEIVLAPGFFLSYVLSAFLMALVFALFDHGLSLTSEIMVFLVIGTALLLPARWIIKRHHQQAPDINQY